MRRLLIILVALVLVSVPVVGFGATEQRVALVIGNGNYMDDPLRNPVNDATDMASALKKLGFSVTLKTDANQRAMDESIRAFGSTLRSGGVGLFYYAGHGIQSRGTNYLIPVYSEIKSEADVKYEAVDAGRVLSQMEDAGNSLNIIILDACRNNPFARSFRSSEKGLAKMDAPKGSILAYSTSPGSVAADGSDRNGLYTEKLLKHMLAKGITIERMFKLVRKDVTRGSGEKQVPWESSSLIGDFYFSPGQSIQPARAIAVEQKQTPQNLNAEEEMWGVVKTSTVVTDYYRFLDAYPDSRFGEAAKLKIQQLKREQDAKPMLASVTPDTKRQEMQSISEVIAEDGNLVKYSTGVIYDKQTNLEWFVGPDEDTSWHEAEKWAKELNVAGGGWRLPKGKELRTIHKPISGKRKLSHLFKTSVNWVWSAYKTYDQMHTSQHAYYFGGHFKSQSRYNSANSNLRAFAVRPRK